MKTYTPDQIRNISLLGHSGAGKTMFTEALLYASEAQDKIGSVEQKTTASDYGQEEKERGSSIATSVVPIEYNNTKYNILDIPGYFEFVGEMYGPKRVSDGSVIIIDAPSGVEVGTEKAWSNVEKYNTPRMIFLNKINAEQINFEKVYQKIKSKLGDKVIPFTVPIGEGEGFMGYFDVLERSSFAYVGNGFEAIETPEKMKTLAEKYTSQLDEIVAESSEELMDKYFEGEAFTREEFIQGIREAVINGELCPLFIGAADQGRGVLRLLEAITRYFPAPSDHQEFKGLWEENLVTRQTKQDDPLSIFVFKTFADPFVGRLSLFKVISGTLKKGMILYNSTKGIEEKMGALYYAKGNEKIETDQVVVGDIAVMTKLEDTSTGDTLCDKENPIVYEQIRYPDPVYFRAIKAVDQKDDDKLMASLQKLNEEDPSFKIVRNNETNELLLGGQGDVQLDIIKQKLSNRFKVNIEMFEAKIAYRETITKTVEVQGKHKKQSGGAGQYGDVWIRFEPFDGDFEFEENIFGGSVPKSYFPAVEKGLEEVRRTGTLAGYPVTNFKAVLYDGSYHDVDSNEMAFKLASQLAFRNGMKEANPVLLEPIVTMEVETPEEYLGDIMGDLNKRRGHILGLEQLRDGTRLVIADLPQAEITEYAIDLRSMTQARGKFSYEFNRYERVPKEIAEKIIEKANK